MVYSNGIHTTLSGIHYSQAFVKNNIDIVQEVFPVNTEHPIHTVSKQTHKILIVDDDKAFLSMISGTLASLDDRLLIDTARSGKECLQKVRKFSPHLVFLDIGMDGMNGLVTLRFIKSMDKKTIVYFLSGHAVEYIKDAVGMVEADGYFTKTQFLDLLKTANSIEEILNAGNSAS